MKNLLLLLAAAALLSSCQKNKSLVAPELPAETPVAKPVAAFRIANTNDANDIIEFRKLQFQNTSANADSYTWTFSSGAKVSDASGNEQALTASEMTEPANVFISPCFQNVSITLTARNKKGDESSVTQTFYVQCFRGVGGRHADHP